MLKNWILLSLSALLIITALCGWRGYQALKAGEEYMKKGEFQKATLSFEQSILFSFPGIPYAGKAVQHLFRIGDQAAQKGDVPKAVMAYNSILFSEGSLSTYWIRPPDHYFKAYKRLKALGPDFTGDVPAQPPLWPPEGLPHRFWALVLGLSLLGWITSVVYIIRKGFGPEGKVRPHYALRGTMAFIGFLGLWIYSMIHL
jgi:hypothetical protein